MPLKQNNAIGPQLPPHLSNPSHHSSSAQSPPPIGPALPSSHNVTHSILTPHVTTHSSDSDTDDDDLIGPRPPSPKTLAQLKDPAYQSELQKMQLIEQLIHRESKNQQQLDSDQGMERGEWMLVPPKNHSIHGLPGQPMKSRQFNSRTISNTEIDPSWTRLPTTSDAKPSQPAVQVSSKRKSKTQDAPMSVRDQHINASINQYNTQFRDKSLLDTFQTTSPGTKKPKLGSSGFDRERDVLGARPVSKKDQSEMINQAKELNSKFKHGSSAFL